MDANKSKSGIVVNRMFVGDYLLSNLGHEVINLFQTDKGEHYLYLNAYGNFSKEHSGKIGTMLMVKAVGGKTVEVIAMATGLEKMGEVDQPYMKYEKNTKNAVYEEQLDLIDKNEINYGGVPVNKIFSDAEQQSIFVTFKAETVSVPASKKRIFIQYGMDKKNQELAQKLSADNCHVVVLEGYKFPSTSLKSYIYPENVGPDADKMQKDYEKVLNEIVQNKKLWTTDREWKVEVKPDNPFRKRNLFEICHIQNDENCISNALAYFMMQPQYKALWQDFFKSLNKGISLQSDYVVEREVDASIDNENWDKGHKPGGGRIDLLITDPSNVIVIENKIKSGINSKESDLKEMNQLDRYVNFVESNQIPYKKKNKPEVTGVFQGHTAHYLILAPNYNIPDPKEVNDKYFIVTYKQLYDFLSKNEYAEVMEKDADFRALKDVLLNHTWPTANEYLYYEMLDKFQRRIAELTPQ